MIVKKGIDKFLDERGVWLSEEKTKILNLRTDPLNFLGYTFRYREFWKPKYGFFRNRVGRKGIAMYPNPAKVKGVISQLREIFRESTNLDSYNLIAKLNPVIRGWSNYFNLGNSSNYRDHVRQALYRLAWKWALKKHPRWGKKKIALFYFKNEGLFKNRKWVFRGETKSASRYKKNLEGKTIYLVDPTNIVSTQSAMEYLIPKSLKSIHAFHSERERKRVVQINVRASLLSQGFYGSFKEKLMKKQGGTCPICNESLLWRGNEMPNIEEIEIHHIQPISQKGERHKMQNMMLIHKWCHRKVHKVESHHKKGRTG